MTQVRKAKIKELEPLAWLTGHNDPGVWHSLKFLSPYFYGACERALALGYRIEVITDHEGRIPMGRIARLLHNRGIPGVVVTHQFRHHVRFVWDSIAALSLEGRMLAPPLHQVKTHHFHNVLLAMKMLRRFGYRRIGVCLEEEVDRSSYHAIKAAILYFQASLAASEKLTPLFVRRSAKEDLLPASELENMKLMLAWVQRSKPDVIVCLNNRFERWLSDAGICVPEDVGLVHLATDDDVSDWAGINSKKREIGAAAVEQLVSLIQNRQFGIPQTPATVEIRGTWHQGRTLLIPKPK
jgi:LacI family transcriptional regulator